MKLFCLLIKYNFLLLNTFEFAEDPIIFLLKAVAIY